MEKIEMRSCEEMMVETLLEVKIKCGDIQDLFGERYEFDEYLKGVVSQSEVFIDMIDTTKLLVYGYYRHMYEIDNENNEESDEFKLGKKAVVDAVFMVTNPNDIFEAYPDDEEIMDKAMSEADEEFILQTEGVSI